MGKIWQNRLFKANTLVRLAACNGVAENNSIKFPPFLFYPKIYILCALN
jgi:hypothetical protein